jgi:hypothetical protein
VEVTVSAYGLTDRQHEKRDDLISPPTGHAPAQQLNLIG